MSQWIWKLLSLMSEGDISPTRYTLCKYSGSMLAAMFSGEMQPGLRDSQGRFFIDRSGDWFAVILSYLREEPIQLPPFGIQRQALAGEAQYYQVRREYTSYCCHTLRVYKLYAACCPIPYHQLTRSSCGELACVRPKKVRAQLVKLQTYARMS